MAERATRIPALAVIELIQAVVLAGNLVWTTLCLGGYRPETMVITSALTGILLVLHLIGRAIFTEAGQPTHPAGWLFLPFLAYAAANVLWITPVPWLGWHDWLWWAQMIAVFWVVLNWTHAKAGTRVLQVTLALLGCAAVVLAAYQIFVQPNWLMLGRQQAEQFIGRASGPFGIPNSLAALLLLLLPPVVAMAIRPGTRMVQRVLFGYIGGVFIFGLVLTVSRGAWIALALTVLGWPLLAGQRNWAWRFRRIGWAALAVVSLGAALFFTVPTLRSRFEIMVAEAGERTRPIMWRGAWQLFRENPVWGSGAGSYNVAFEKHRPPQYQLNSQWAHNDYLNTLSDYGSVGFGLFFGVCGWLVIKGIRLGRGQLTERDNLDDPLGDKVFWSAVAFGLAAFGLQLFVDFHLKIPALAMMLATLAGLLLRRHWPPNQTVDPLRNRVSQVLGVVAGVTVLLALILFVVPHYRAEALRYSARQAIDRLSDLEFGDYSETLMPARNALNRAVGIDPTNAQAWGDLAYATSLWAHVAAGDTKKLGRQAEDQAKRALALTTVVPEYWLRQAVALDMQGLWTEAGKSCNRAKQLAPSLALVWYHQAYHLSLNPIAHSEALAAVELCLRLDPGNRPAQLLRHQLATIE